MNILWNKLRPITCLLILLQGCSPDQEQVDHQADPLNYARGFRLTPAESGWDLDLIRFYAEEPDTLHYEFRAVPDSGQIPWPAQRIVTLSATHIGMVLFAGQREAIVGVDRKAYAHDSLLRSRIEQGLVAEVGESGQLDLERVLTLKPDLVLISGFPEGLSRDVARLQELGIPLLPVAEWQETHPLARADWALVVAAALGQHDRVAAQLDSVRAAYEILRAKVSGETTRPLVLTGSPFQGTWYVPAGESFIASLVRDAGGRTAWEDRPGSASLPMDPEVVYPIGLQADIWLNPGAFISKEELVGAFPRYESFPAVQAGQVFNYYRQARGDGANAYWEQSAVRPDQVLKDLISIFHPGLTEDSSLTFYLCLPS